MFCAPTVTLTARLTRQPDGAAGIFATVRAMRDAIDRGKTDPDIISAAGALIYTTPERAECSEVAAIFEFVRDSIRYVRDPVGVESLADPAITLRRMLGDCDDQAALLGALLESVGYPVRLTIAAYQRPGVWEHTYLECYCDGQWIALDPTEYGPIGYAPPGALSIWNEAR